MNILNLFPTPDDVGGSERSLHLGAQVLRAMGHRVYLLHGRDDPLRTADGYDGHLGITDLFDRRSWREPPGLRGAERQAEAFLRRERIDVLHVQGWPRTATLERWARTHAVVATTHVALCPNNARYLWKERRACERAIGLGCATVGFARKGCGHLGNGQPYGLTGFVRGMADDHRLRRAIGRCSRVIAPSEWIKGRLTADGIDPRRIRVLPPPISGDPERIDALPVESPPVLSFVGRLVDFKGPDHLLKASARIARPHRVWFIGDGPMRAELQRLADRLGVRERVTFFGALAPKEITAYRLKSAVVVVPSLWPDKFPMVGPEAMLLGRPVVAFRVGGIPEWLQDGVTGRLAAPGDSAALAAAIEEILHEPGRARAMGQAGRAAALRWVPHRHARGLLEIYAEAIADRKGGAGAGSS